MAAVWGPQASLMAAEGPALRLQLADWKDDAPPAADCAGYDSHHWHEWTAAGGCVAAQLRGGPQKLSVAEALTGEERPVGRNCREKKREERKQASQLSRWWLCQRGMYCEEYCCHQGQPPPTHASRAC